MTFTRLMMRARRSFPIDVRQSRRARASMQQPDAEAAKVTRNAQNMCFLRLLRGFRDFCVRLLK
jgi:hypothetical protein